MAMVDRLQLLRSCLALFEGVHAFHNFTKRRLYRDDVRERMRRKHPKRMHTCLSHLRRSSCLYAPLRCMRCQIDQYSEVLCMHVYSHGRQRVLQDD